MSSANRQLRTVVLASLTWSSSSIVTAATSFAVYTGTSHSHASTVRFRQPATASDAAFHGVHWDPKPFEDAPYYGVRIAYQPSQFEHVAFSVEFTHYKMYANTEREVAVRGVWNGAAVDGAELMSTRVPRIEISHGVNLTGLNVEYRWPTASRWTPYVGAGAVAYFPHAEGEVNGVPVEADYQHAGLGYQLFAGTDLSLSRHFALIAQVKYDSGNLDIALSPDTRLETDTDTVHALVGIAWTPSPR